MCMTRRWSRDPDSSRILIPSTDCRNFIVHPRTTNDLIYSSARIVMSRFSSALLYQRLDRRSFWPWMCTQWMYMWLHTINIFIITLLFIWTLSVTKREDHQSKELNVGQMVKANGMDFSLGFIVFHQQQQQSNQLLLLLHISLFMSLCTTYAIPGNGSGSVIIAGQS